MFASLHILIIKAADGAGPDLSRETLRFGRGPPELKAQLVAFFRVLPASNGRGDTYGCMRAVKYK